MSQKFGFYCSTSNIPYVKVKISILGILKKYADETAKYDSFFGLTNS